ncbi:DJ-1/PfpI family protein [Cognatilysobacter lacus]|uniref:Transcriptional regulator n=1 Tax=Cognatilysobacter lacus TaxID=1643323 RepID=A0A5D8Z881_9GAMM|nr:DJ-1/PfpI family protein [Lysobacter lacus]TZF90877.1 transcriptional regulator [Lysobacter lacus]
MHLPPSRSFAPLFVALAALVAAIAVPRTASGITPPLAAAVPTKMPAWVSTHGHVRALVAIAAENSGTELTDFAIPYAVLKRAGIDTVALAAHEGPLRFRPALRAQLDATMAGFDAQHPEGADYVIVPAMVKRDDATVLAWIAAQSRKGATVVSICDGALVVGNAGLLKGRWATAHWASESQRVQDFPTTHWVRNTRYVADGNVMSSAGISAAMPISIALVEAIAGSDRAAAVARGMGVADWSARHDSEVFRPHYGNLAAFATKLAFNPYLRRSQTVGVPLTPGMDEIALAVTADAYSRTGRSQALSVAPSSAPVTSRYGLRFLPDVTAASSSVDVRLPPLAAVAPGQVFDTVLAGVEARYGHRTAYAVALDFEYPGFAP